MRTDLLHAGGLVGGEQRHALVGQLVLADLDHTTPRDDDASLLDDIPLPADTIDLQPERIQAALYQAFDIQALYKPDMH